jgi:hypothetical protein
MCRLTVRLGAIVLQPDMADPSKVNEEGFGLKIGYAVILLAFRLQQTNEKKKYDILHF